MANILIIDDEQAIRNALRDIFELEDYVVEEAKDGIEALAKLKQGKFEVVICDIKMPKMDGMDVLERIQAISPDIPVVMISGHGNIETAVEAVKKGAFDYISKPLDMNRILITVRNAQDRSSLVAETKILKKKIRKTNTQQIIGESANINKIKQTIDKVAATDARVLVLGQNGTGKELVARWLHEKSDRAEKQLIEVNCAAIPSELIDSELFGHEKGAFTSAMKQHVGKFEQAHGGTLFLDEIGDMSLSAQAKVLRALQEHKITRVGGEKDITVDVRIVAATNKDLRQEIAAGRFREDLYHRLAVIIIPVPALNERKEDIPLLVNHFLDTICAESGRPLKKISPEAVALLQDMDWTGNIRELRNVVERLLILSDMVISADDVLSYVAPTMNKSARIETLKNIFDKYEQWDSVQAFVKTEFERWNSLK
jgi:two-component system, NtrC family, nitrogen regulation response regulator NtrX